MRTLTCMPREPLVFGQPRSPSSSSSALHLQRDPAHVVPGDARARIEIDAQLVGMVEVAGAHRVRVQLDAAEVDDPGQARGVVDDDLLGGAARGKRQRHRAQPGRPLVGRALLVERLALGAVDEALEHDGPVADAAPARPSRDRQVVADEVELARACASREKYGLLGCVTRTSRPSIDRTSACLFLAPSQSRLHHAAAWPTRSKTCSTCCASWPS